MVKSIIVFIVLFCIANSIFSQSAKTEDVIYLNNQWIIRGQILNRDSASVKILTHDGNTFVFAANEVDKIVKENTWGGFTYRKKGFANFTELGPLIAGKTTIEGVTTAAFSFQTINGYKFSQHAMLGLGLGADLYATQTILPVFGSFRGDISKGGSVIPFYFGDAGYGINITQNSVNGTAFRGGVMYALGLGLKIPFNRNSGFLLSAGYRYQKTSYKVSNSSTDVFYKRLAIRAGFFL
ncbi:MAG: hypothetical protein M3R50_12520 [Bacteroidota bacterium]|nr:hypothetical protein [Bacteroidota bacterium]